MLVGEVMKASPVTVEPDATLDRAYALMRERGIRHLPVLEDRRLVGVVTDRDLRLATSRLAERPFGPDDVVREVMSRPVHTTNPGDPIETAARTMRELKIGCLPVLDGDRLVGIVTGVDILDALLVLTGVGGPSGRLELRLVDRPGELERLAAALAARGVNVQSILTYPEGGHRGRIVLRVATMEVRALAAALAGLGFEVLWPPHRP